jgi:hypothetical protein
VAAAVAGAFAFLRRVRRGRGCRGAPGAWRDWRGGRAARAHLLEGSVHAALGAGAVAALAALARARPRLGARLTPALAVVLYAEAAAASPFAIHVGSAAAARACPPALEAPAPGPRILTALVHNVTGQRGLDPIDAARIAGPLGVASPNAGCGPRPSRATPAWRCAPPRPSSTSSSGSRWVPLRRDPRPVRASARRRGRRLPERPPDGLVGIDR